METRSGGSIKATVPWSTKICGVNHGEPSFEDMERALCFASFFLQICFSILLTSMLRSSKLFLSNTNINMTGVVNAVFTHSQSRNNCITTDSSFIITEKFSLSWVELSSVQFSAVQFSHTVEGMMQYIVLWCWLKTLLYHDLKLMEDYWIALFQSSLFDANCG